MSVVAGKVLRVSNIIPFQPTAEPTALEFFAGVGLARMGLERAGFKVTWSNDYEPLKHAMYSAHFKDGPEHTYVVGDIGDVSALEIPQNAKIAWASSPCTDLSLAGARSGLKGKESSAFWLWIKILKEMGDQAPAVAVLENVTGLATSHGGDDLRAAIRALNELGYSVDILSIDARRFVAQSRPRLFLIGAKTPPQNSDEPSELRPDWTANFYGDSDLLLHRAPLPLPPPLLTRGFGSFVEKMKSSDERWWNETRTCSFISSLSPIQTERITKLRNSPGIKYRTAYRRTRHGKAVWEVRADDIAGCLRTARGGSSKQAVVRVGNNELQVRWMTPREYARLMGAPEYTLDGAATNQALYGFGDAVAVPVVEWLATEYLYPLVTGEFPSHSISLPNAATHSS